MRDDGPSGAAPGEVVRLDSRQLIAAHRLVSALADRIRRSGTRSRSERRSRFPTLADGGPTQRAAVWLEEQLAGLQSLADLAQLLETTGGNATYDGAGTFAEAASRIGPEIAHVLDSLDPGSQQDLAALDRTLQGCSSATRTTPRSRTR